MLATEAQPMADVPAITMLEIGLIVFLAFFVLIVIWVLLRKRGAYERAARIPLEDDVVTPRSGNQTRNSSSNGSAGAER